MNANYILTAFAPSMFGAKATAHIRLVDQAEAQRWVTADTRIVANKISHERLAKAQLPGAGELSQRYAELTPGKSAIVLSYRGPAVPETGEMPPTGSINYFLIEVEEYQEPE